LTIDKLWTRAISVAAVAAVGLALSGCSLFNQITNDTPRDDDGTVVEGNDDADVFSIRVGDCLNDAGTSGTVTTAPIVPCDEPHDSEAYASFLLEDGDFPGDEGVSAAANQLCYDAFEEFAGIAWEDSIYDFSYYLPTEDSWNNRGDREVLCTIFDGNGQVTGTLESIGI
jgi:hypothetical protein